MITGTAGIPSAETFGSPANAGLSQRLISGATGIASAEGFGQPTGLLIDISTVPVSANYSY